MKKEMKLFDLNSVMLPGGIFRGGEQRDRETLPKGTFRGGEQRDKETLPKGTFRGGEQWNKESLPKGAVRSGEQRCKEPLPKGAVRSGEQRDMEKLPKGTFRSIVCRETSPGTYSPMGGLCQQECPLESREADPPRHNKEGNDSTYDLRIKMWGCKIEMM